MANTLKEEAENYEPKKTANIADLEKFDISEPMEDREGKDNEGKVFKYKVLVRDGTDYRVPNSVLPHRIRHPRPAPSQDPSKAQPVA